MEKWVPVVGSVSAAVLALTGVLIGLNVTGSRARRESRISREDDARTNARAAVARLLTAAETYQRQGRVFSDEDEWLGYEDHEWLRKETENAMAELQQSLVTARLIVDDARLRDDIDELARTANATATVVHSVVRAFRLDQPTVAQEERELCWKRFDQASKALQADTLAILRPTVRDENFKP